MEKLPSEVTISPHTHEKFHRVDNVKDHSQLCPYYIIAPGGTVKTYFIFTMQECLKVFDRSFISKAASALAAKIINGGRITNSTFKNLISCRDEDARYTFDNLNETQKLCDVFRIFRDKMVMCHYNCLEAVDSELKEITQNTHLFSGKPLLCPKDLRQIFPVVPSSFRAQVFSTCGDSSLLYRRSQTVQLTQNMRLRSFLQYYTALEEAVQFSQFLIQVSERNVSTDSSNYINVPQYIHTVCKCNYLHHYNYEQIEEESGAKERLKSREINTPNIICLQRIN